MTVLHPTPTQFDEATVEEARSILSIASDCDDPAFLARCREVYPARLLNTAAKKLTPQQHAKITRWVIEVTVEFCPGDRVININYDSPSYNVEGVVIERITNDKPPREGQYNPGVRYVCIMDNRESEGIYAAKHLRPVRLDESF